MKKYYKLLFIILFLFTSHSNLYAKGDRDFWLTAGYSYTIPDAKELQNSILGPANLTFGVDLWKFIGLDITLGNRWGYDLDIGVRGDFVDINLEETFYSFDIKPYLLLQPKIGLDILSLRPYIGIGPSFYFVNSSTPIEKINSFDVGFSAKAGIRLQVVKFLFLGVGAEYLYHKGAEIYSNNVLNKDTNLSGWTVGLEIGAIF